MKKQNPFIFWIVWFILTKMHHSTAFTQVSISSCVLKSVTILSLANFLMSHFFKLAPTIVFQPKHLSLKITLVKPKTMGNHIWFFFFWIYLRNTKNCI